MDNRSGKTNSRACRIAAVIIMWAAIAFLAVTAVQFIQAVSTLTLLIIGGIILSWRIWKFMFKLLWLLLQIGIFFYVIYLLIV